MSKKADYKWLRIRPRTHKRITDLKGKDESYDELLNRLAEAYERANPE